MNIETKTDKNMLVLVLSGRLDATWADSLLNVARDELRKGHHHLRADCSGLIYLSSAGIRCLIRLHRETAAISGSFLIRNPSEFVDKTLRQSGLEPFLESAEAKSVPDQPVGAKETVVSARELDTAGMKVDLHALKSTTAMTLDIAAGWRPWQAIADGDLHKMPFPAPMTALGIGAPGDGADDVRNRLGEFVAVAGCVSWNPPNSADKPDYLVLQEQYVPELTTVQALVARGDFSHLIRFSPQENGAVMSLSDLLETALTVTGAAAAVLVTVAEIQGLVGTSLCRSPGLMTAADHPDRYPEVLDWLGFCGDRLHGGRLAVMVSFAAREGEDWLAPYLAPLPACPQIAAHVHALVFPYRPLQEGSIDLLSTVQSLFADSEPQDLLHLIEDSRPLVGIGQSALFRGACWCAGLQLGRGGAR